MTIDLNKLKALATATAANQYDAVALNDYGMAVPPATVLDLITEIERHRRVNAEGCKPDNSIQRSCLPCAGATSCRSLDKAEGCKPELNIHPDLSITRIRREIEVAENELMMAQVGLLAAAREAYPVGSRLRIKVGRNTIEVVVKGHVAAWWSRPGYIHATNPKTGKPHTFPHGAVLEVIQEVLP
ncbi:MAG: hypothetical protein WCC29_00960 [Pseudomonas farsensis]